MHTFRKKIGLKNAYKTYCKRLISIAAVDHKIQESAVHDNL